MAPRPLFPTLLTLTSLLFTLPTPASAADDAAKKKKLVACVNKDITAANSEWKLKAEDLKKFTSIIDREFMKEPLGVRPDDQGKSLKEIETAAKRELPHVRTETIDKMAIALKEKAAHCTKLVQ